MLKHSMTAVFIAAIISFPVAANATNDTAGHFSKTCMTPVAAWQNGLVGLPETMSETMSKNALRKMMTAYGNLVRATAQSQACFHSALELTTASRQASRSGLVSPRVIQLQRGVNEVGRIFALGRGQFKAAFDQGSAAMLARLAPAAGLGVKAGAGKGDKMAWIETGMSLLENSKKIAARQLNLKYLARQPHQ